MFSLKNSVAFDMNKKQMFSQVSTDLFFSVPMTLVDYRRELITTINVEETDWIGKRKFSSGILILFSVIFNSKRKLANFETSHRKINRKWTRLEKTGRNKNSKTCLTTRRSISLLCKYLSRQLHWCHLENLWFSFLSTFQIKQSVQCFSWEKRDF